MSAGDAIWPRHWGNQSCPGGHSALWLLGYPEACLAEISNTRSTNAREIGHAATLMLALYVTRFDAYLVRELRGRQKRNSDEASSLWWTRRAAPMWKAYGMLNQGWIFSLTEKALDAVQTITSGLTALRSTGINTMDTVVFSTFGASLCGTRPIR